MDFMELAKARFSVRRFSGREVPQEIIEKILTAGHIAPTGCNNQPQRIYVIKSKEGLAKLRECTRCHFDAPLVFAVCFDKRECWTRPYDGKLSGDIDASIVTTHMMLEAAALGIGSCWVMHYRPEALKEMLGLSDEIESTALLVMGYPADDAAPAPGHTELRPMEELVSYI